jgi:hypothetical protein
MLIRGSPDTLGAPAAAYGPLILGPPPDECQNHVVKISQTICKYMSFYSHI